MTRAIEWLISLLIVVALFVAIGLFLPSKRSVSHSVETNRPMATVFDSLDSFARFKDWNTLVNYDPRMSINVTGPERGEGAKLEYSSMQRQIGEGSWTLVEAVPGERIVYALDNNASGEDKRMTFELERTGQRNQNVRITQRYTVDYGWNLIGRYAGLYVTRNVGDDIKRGLAKFSNLMATIPRFDYSQHPNEFQIVDVPASNLLIASATAKRSNDEIAIAMTNQLKWIEQVMEKSELEAAGPMRIITTDFGPETYAFDVAMPVRRKGTGPADEGDDGDEAEGAEGEGAEGAEATAAVEPAPAVDPNAPLERLDVKLEGEGNPVIYAQQPAMRAASTTYMGSAAGLARVRDLVRAWAMVRGNETADRPFEQYGVEIKNMLNEDAEYTVYWPLRVNGENPQALIQILPEPAPEADESTAPATGEGESAPADTDEAAEAA